MSQTQENILADSISGIPHLAAFDAMSAARMNGIELENMLVYVIDTVSSAALPVLARQFDIEGFRGYGLATTDAQRRVLIKQAIELKRYMGTVWAIKQAMLSVGYEGATLVEGIDTGDVATDWARFSIESIIGDTVGVDGATQTELAKLVREYKPQRSFLQGISYVLSTSDEIGSLIDDLFITYESPVLEEDLGYISRFHDGTYFRDGSITYIESHDTLTMNIINV